MKTPVTGMAIAALLIGSALPGFAEDAAPPRDSTAPATTAPAAARTEAPANVPRPSIAPKTAEPASPAAAEPAPRRTRRQAQRQYRRQAYWEPFPVYWPHLRRHKISWSRIPWFRF